MSVIRTLSTRDTDFNEQLDRLLATQQSAGESIDQTVQKIIGRVREQGDQALLEYVQRFEGWAAGKASDLEIQQEQLQKAWEGCSAKEQEALMFASERIESYAKAQKIEPWNIHEEDGTMLGQQVTALDRVGIYVPGGKASYPSSVLMNAIPAKVAGVPERVMTVPTPNGERNELVLAAAYLCGVERVFAIGGAQAIAAMAYGTELVPAVDKIVGPGNIYVATAKRAVFGQVGIDMIAGPSEIMVVCDGSSDPDWVAMDLFSQAEHDERAQSILLSPDAAFIEQVNKSIERLLPTMERASIITAALGDRGALILCRDLEEACQIVNRVAPEHLELSMNDAEVWLPEIRNAGAIFIGPYSSEPLGDYCAGPNHVLPTSGTARFSSPLGVYDFQKRSSLIMASPQGADRMGRMAALLARKEGLSAHARAAEYRLKS